jgi:hypothetical protein
VHLFQIAKEGGLAGSFPLALDIFKESLLYLVRLGEKIVVPVGAFLQGLGNIADGGFRANWMIVRARLAGGLVADEGVSAFGASAEMGNPVARSAPPLRLLLFQLTQLKLHLGVNPN